MDVNRVDETSHNVSKSNYPMGGFYEERKDEKEV